MKRHYTPQCLAHVEKILEAFPAQRQQLAVLDDFIAASIRSPAISDMPGGGGADSEPERILAAKERSPQYRDLAQSVETVRRALRVLPRRDLTFVDMRYWRRMGMVDIADAYGKEIRSLWRWRDRILSRLVPFLFRHVA